MKSKLAARLFQYRKAIHKDLRLTLNRKSYWMILIWEWTNTRIINDNLFKLMNTRQTANC